jgi:hypothetical protein
MLKWKIYPCIKYAKFSTLQTEMGKRPESFFQRGRMAGKKEKYILLLFAIVGMDINFQQQMRVISSTPLQSLRVDLESLN